MRWVRWIRKNLFQSVGNGFLTITIVGFLLWTLPPLLNWLFFNATFSGVLTDCHPAGACWVFIQKNWDNFLYGFYPEAERWRIRFIYGLGIGLVVLWIILRRYRCPVNLLVGIGVVILYFITAFIFFSGGVFELPYVSTHLWGGLHLTLVVAITGIALSLPFGIVLALGRFGKLPIFRWSAIGLIEFIRGVPLITLLFMASVMFPIFLPPWLHWDKLLRALIAVTLFASAYMAEVIRGGLQAIPRGQYEAAKALGFNDFQMMRQIIMPQVLRMVIPGIVNTFIGLFKDTTLVLVIGLLDLLGMAQAVLTNPKWVAYSPEGYVFVGFVFWVFCFFMSRYSQSLEAHRVVRRNNE